MFVHLFQMATSLSLSLHEYLYLFFSYLCDSTILWYKLSYTQFKTQNLLIFELLFGVPNIGAQSLKTAPLVLINLLLYTSFKHQLLNSIWWMLIYFPPSWTCKVGNISTFIPFQNYKLIKFSLILMICMVSPKWCLCKQSLKKTVWMNENTCGCNVSDRSMDGGSWGRVAWAQGLCMRGCAWLVH